MERGRWWKKISHEKDVEYAITYRAMKPPAGISPGFSCPSPSCQLPIITFSSWEMNPIPTISCPWDATLSIWENVLSASTCVL